MKWEIRQYLGNEIFKYEYCAGKACYGTFFKLFKKLDELDKLGYRIVHVKIGYTDEFENETYYVTPYYTLMNDNKEIIKNKEPLDAYKTKYRCFRVIYKT